MAPPTSEAYVFEQARVACDVVPVYLENENGREVEGVVATCSRCGHETESYGTGAASVRRCLALLRVECPCAAGTFNVDGDGDTG